MGEEELQTAPLMCSTDGQDILGTAAVIGNLDDEQDWTEKSGGQVAVYHGSEDREFLLLHPKCLHDLLDEVLRQEGQTSLLVSIGPVDEVRAALEI